MVLVDAIDKSSYNLDFRNPYVKDNTVYLQPEQILEDILDNETKILEIVKEIRQAIESQDK